MAKAEKAHKWLLESLNNGTIPIDFNYLENQRRERINYQDKDSQKNFERIVHCLIEFNPFGKEGLATMSKIKQIYSKHTAPDFRDNLKHLMRQETVTIKDYLFSQPFSIEVDLLTKEDRAKHERKATRASRWNPSRWALPQKTIAPKMPEEKEASLEALEVKESAIASARPQPATDSNTSVTSPTAHNGLVSHSIFSDSHTQLLDEIDKLAVKH